VHVQVHPLGAREARIVIDAQSYGDRYGFEPGAPPDRQPLLEAAIAEVGIPEGVSVEIQIRSQVPAGASTGTSAAVAVALIGALDALTPGRLTAREVAYAAHRVEVERLGLQSGIQDQLCGAHGGINYIEIDPYPQATVTQLAVGTDLRAELN